MKIKFYLLFCIALCCTNGFAQTAYHAGFAQKSIEPQDYPFSLALAGYGLPRDGRFTLKWVKQTTPDAAVRKQMETILSKKTGVPGSVASVVIGNRSYMADSSGKISSAGLSEKRKTWKQITVLPGIQSLTAHAGVLFGLTNKNEIWKYDIQENKEPWVKIAQFNGLAYNIELKAIFFNGNQLIGLDKDRLLYKATHQTEGFLGVEALAIAQQKQRVVLVTVDLCGFNADFINDIKAEVYKKHKIPASAVLINASHTHFAPGSQSWTTWGPHNQRPDKAYLYGVVRPAIISSITTAISSMAPAELYFGRGKTAIGFNRRLKGADVPYDNDVDVLQIINKKNKNKTVLFSTGCHPVAGNVGLTGITISANYPGITRNYLKKEGGITNAMFVQGCGGDINPKEEVEYIKTGEALGKDILNVLHKELRKIEGNITFFMDSVNFPVTKLIADDLEDFKAKNSLAIGDVYAEKNVRWAELMQDLKKNNKLPTQMPVYIQTVNIGSWKLVGISRETVTEYSIGIKALWPDRMVSVAGYCNDVSSYLPTSKHIRGGGYEGYDSFLWYGQPAIFPESVYDTILQRIKDQNH
ncbi:hypothetical protein [Pedobacter heparinus]|uniref:hypothetical protein n=1 Tax=Pedobacter heparinus TaxID=984 RepID=UPI00292F9155|nr:hypothetical protein [Pedobacter heparinus]